MYMYKHKFAVRQIYDKSYKTMHKKTISKNIESAAQKNRYYVKSKVKLRFIKRKGGVLQVSHLSYYKR